MTSHWDYLAKWQSSQVPQETLAERPSNRCLLMVFE